MTDRRPVSEDPSESQSLVGLIYKSIFHVLHSLAIAVVEHTRLGFSPGIAALIEFFCDIVYDGLTGSRGPLVLLKHGSILGAENINNFFIPLGIVGSRHIPVQFQRVGTRASFMQKRRYGFMRCSNMKHIFIIFREME